MARGDDDPHRLLLERLPDCAVSLLDAEGRVETWSAAAERITGWSAADVRGRTLAGLYLPEEREDGQPARDLAAAAAGGCEREGWCLRRDGARLWAGIVIAAWRDERGAPRGFAALLRDLSDRKRADETAAAHRRSTEQLAVILGGVADGITVQDRSGRLVYANDAAGRICGYADGAALVAAPAGEAVARFEILDEEGRPFPPDRLPGRLALRGAAVEPTLVKYRDLTTGQDRWTLIKARAIRDAGGEPELAINILHDVTAAQRQKEGASFLAEASGLLAASLDYQITLARIAELVVPRLADWCSVHMIEEGVIRMVAAVHADPSLRDDVLALSACTPPDVHAPREVGAVVRTGRAELYTEIGEDLLKAGAGDPKRLALRSRLGLTSALIVPLAARGRTLGALAFARAGARSRYDEQDLALAEELGRRAGMAVDNASLFRGAQRAVKVRDDFLSIAGHEFKTPLASLQLQLQSLQRHFRRNLAAEPEQLADRLDKAGAQVARLGRLVNDLLDVSRISGGQLALEREDCDLAAVTAEVIDRFADELADAGCRIDLRVEPVVGRWDRMRLDQVVSNLIDNAVKYGRSAPIEVSVAPAQGGAAARLVVRDRGIGIDRDQQRRIFERFERAVSEHSYGGLGLGLWIARQIVEAHGGTIAVDSAPGAGSSFAVELPVT